MFITLDMDLIRKSVLVLCIAITLNNVNSIYLNSIRKHYQRNDSKESSKCSVQYINNVKHNTIGNLATKDVYSKQMTKISGNPCNLVKIASLFDINSMQVLVSKQISIADQKACTGIFAQHVKKSAVYIEGNHNHFDNLKRNAPHYFKKDFKCFVIICSEICTSFLLNIEDTLGFSADIYIWITSTRPVYQRESRYPNKMIQLVLPQDSSEELNQHCYLYSENETNIVNFSTHNNQFNHHKNAQEIVKIENIIGEPLTPLNIKCYFILYFDNFLENHPSLAKRTKLNVATNLGG